jgi:hypothetical protein
VKLRTVLWWAFWGFVVWFCIEQPASAAHAVHQLGAALTAAGNGLGDFVKDI